MEELLTTRNVDQELALPYVGKKGRDLVGQILEDGPDCVTNLGSRQVRYCGAICVRKGIQWPDEFFDHSVDELMSLD